MKTTVVAIPTALITDWASFHAVFAEVLGFPDFYGDNMNAWIDCMTDADDADTGMIARAVRPGELLTLRIDDASDFAARCPDQFNALVECTAVVNLRRVEMGGVPVLALLMSGRFK